MDHDKTDLPKYAWFLSLKFAKNKFHLNFALIAVKSFLFMQQRL